MDWMTGSDLARVGLRRFGRVLPLLTLLTLVAAANSATRHDSPHAVGESSRARAASWDPRFQNYADLPPARFVEVKFRPSSGIRVSAEGVVSRDGEPTSWDDFSARHPGLTMARLYSRSMEEIDTERARLASSLGYEAESNGIDEDRGAGSRRAPATAGSLPDLNAWGRVYLPLGATGGEPDPEALKNLAWELARLPEVQSAAPEPRVADAGFVALGGDGPVGEPTPDFSNRQGYLEAAPYGVGARVAWTHRGGDGAGVRLVDLETGSNWRHEDLGDPFYLGGPPEVSNHGCAVCGVLVAVHNGFGVDGIAPALRVGSQSHLGMAYADAMDQAIAQLRPGDILLIEGHTPGPQGFVPVEYHRSIYERILLATRAGVISVEAGGNGGVDLDDPIYDGIFDRETRDSGAIVVAASRPEVGDAFVVSNFGDRLDLNGWGIDVVTTGYGTLFGRGDSLRAYTHVFNGTSSASAVVAGAVASLQGAYLAATGSPLGPAAMRRILVETGTPHAGAHRIGPRPDLARAIPAALGTVGTLRVEVRAADPLRTLRSPTLRVVELGVTRGVPLDGELRIPLPSGEWTVVVDDFGFEPVERRLRIDASMVTAETVSLPSSDTRQVRGRVFDAVGRRLSGASVWLEPSPTPVASTRFDGAFSIAEVPVEWAGVIRADLSGYAPDAVEVAAGDEREFLLRLTRPQRFEASDEGFVGTGDWTWGVPITGPAAFSGERCWGTRLDGLYASDIEHVLTTLPYDLTEASEPRLSLRYWQSMWGLGSARVEIMPFGTLIPEPLAPMGSVHVPCIGSTQPMDCLPGFSGNSHGWQPAVFDLSPYVGGTVRFRFVIDALNRPRNGPGWYIDDVSVHDVAGFDPGFPTSDPYRVILGPNPMSESLQLSMDLPHAAQVVWEVHDVLGRRVVRENAGVRPAGNLALTWTGRDGNGHPTPSGIYWVRVLSGVGEDLREVHRAKVLIVR